MPHCALSWEARYQKTRVRFNAIIHFTQMLLSKFDPWTGLFVDWKVPARMGPRNWEYEVTYFKRGTGFKKAAQPETTSDEQPRFRLIYGLRYCMGNRDEPGYVHLAGYTDKFWEQNVHIVWGWNAGGRMASIDSRLEGIHAGRGGSTGA
jgi:hypothetical protein